MSRGGIVRLGRREILATIYYFTPDIKNKLANGVNNFYIYIVIQTQ